MSDKRANVMIAVIGRDTPYYCLKRLSLILPSDQKPIQADADKTVGNWKAWEDEMLTRLFGEGMKLEDISEQLPNRTLGSCQCRLRRLQQKLW
jgi:hypothetical protein